MESASATTIEIRGHDFVLEYRLQRVQGLVDYMFLTEGLLWYSQQCRRLL